MKQCDIIAIFGACLILIVLFSLMIVHYGSTRTGFEQGKQQGIADTHKEAFKHGLMVKEITKDDKVIYRWVDTHKLGYEE
jgi:hypothetical protein